MILEFYCPGCAALVETEYTVPGHPPLCDLELDLDRLRAQWAERQELTQPAGDGLPPRIDCDHRH